MKIIDQDIIFLSYDEPNAEKNYADLCSKAPWAKRVHGVEGSDAAHKACADLSETENFITIDGDTIIDPKFLQVELDLEKLKKCNPPYNGNTFEELKTYFNEYILDNRLLVFWVLLQRIFLSESSKNETVKSKFHWPDIVEEKWSTNREVLQNRDGHKACR